MEPQFFQMLLKTFNKEVTLFVVRILIALDKYVRHRTNIIVWEEKRIETKNSLKQKDKHTSLIAAHCILKDRLFVKKFN